VAYGIWHVWLYGSHAVPFMSVSYNKLSLKNAYLYMIRKQEEEV